MMSAENTELDERAQDEQRNVSGKRRALESEGVRFIDLRVKAIKILFMIAIRIQPVMTQDVCEHMASGRYDDPLLGKDLL
jgi:hypothetical protein